MTSKNNVLKALNLDKYGTGGNKKDLTGTTPGEVPLSLKVNGEADTVLINNERWLKLGPNAQINLYPKKPEGRVLNRRVEFLKM